MMNATQDDLRRFDNLDNRKALWMLLERLGGGIEGNQRRVTFLKWAAKQCQGPARSPVLVDPKTLGLTWEIYRDLNALAAMYGLDLEQTAIRLEQWVRRL